MFVEVDVEVLLRLQLPLHFLGLHVAQTALLRTAVDLVLRHIAKRLISSEQRRLFLSI